MQTTPPNHFVTIQALNEMIQTEKKFREDIRVFVQLMQESADEIKDPAIKKLIEEYLEPYRALREAESFIDADMLTPDSSLDKINLVVSKLKTSFKSSSAVLNKNKAALSRCAAQKNTFQNFIVGLFSVKKPFYDIFTKSFVDVLNKKYFYARENGVVNKNKESTNAQDWVLSNIMKPVQVSMRYQMPLEAISHFAAKQKLAGNPLPYEESIQVTLVSAKSIAADVNQSVLVEKPKLVAIVTEKPAATKKVTPNEKPKQAVDKNIVKKDYVNHSLHHTKKAAVPTIAKDLNTKVGVIREIIKQKFPEKTNIKALEAIRKDVAKGDDKVFDKLQALARSEIRSHKTFLNQGDPKLDVEIRQLLRCIASGDIEKLKMQLEKFTAIASRKGQ